MSVSLIDGHIDDDTLTLTSGDTNTTSGKIKAIYPHIVVSGSPLKPCYSIEWYDIEKGEMIHGYSSYSLPLVFKWLKEDFEVIDKDIDDLINRQKAELESSRKHTELWVGKFYEQKAKLEALQMDNKQLETDNFNANINCEHLQAEIERLQNLLDLKKLFHKEKQAECNLWRYKYNKALNQLNDYQSIAKAEAVKEFAERVKDFMNDVPMHSEEDFIYVDYFELRDKIDNLVKEMVGEASG